MNGLHHVTAISGPAQRNLDFYTKTLGLRLVKKTVNFDDPGTYHLYYGDATGTPGSVMTFFPWEGMAPGRKGVGETRTTYFAVPEGSLAYWRGPLDGGRGRGRGCPRLRRAVAAFYGSRRYGAGAGRGGA